MWMLPRALGNAGRPPEEGLVIRQLFYRGLGYLTGEGLGPTLVRSLSGTSIVWFSASVVSLAVGVQLARLLGVAAYGYYGMALAIVTVAAIPAEMGLPRLVTREVSTASAREDSGTIYGVLRWSNSIILGVGGLMMGAIGLTAYLLMRNGHTQLGSALLWGAPIIPLMSLTRVRGGALQGLHHVVRGQVPDTLLRPLFLALLILAAALFGGALSAAEAMALNSAAAAITFVVASIWLRNRLPARPSEVARSGAAWFRSAMPMGVTEGMRVLHSEVSILLVGLIATSTGAGLFRIANVTALFASIPVSIINYVAFPTVARLFGEGETAKLQQALTHLARTQFVGVMALCLPLILFAEPLLALVFGAEYAAAADALRILAAGQMASAALGPGFVLLNMTHQERRVTTGITTALVVNLVLLPLLTSMWGIVGAALALSGSLFMWNVLNWVNGRRHLGLEASILPARFLGNRRPETAQWTAE